MSRSVAVLETRGMASLVAASDAMLKVANVQLIGKHGIGSGWLTVAVEGDIADVEAAINTGKIEAERFGELINTEFIPNISPDANKLMPHLDSFAGSFGSRDNRAIGIIETQNLSPLIIATDEMVKSADVELDGWGFVGGALCYTVVRGDTASVQTAISIGRQAGESIGSVYSALVISQPENTTNSLLPSMPEQNSQYSFGALGVVESIGYAGIVAGGDAMVKVADVEILRLSIGSGGRIAALVGGNLDNVQSAIAAGCEVVPQVGTLEGSALISRPDPALLECFIGDVQNSVVSNSGTAMGIVETRSTVALVRAVDQMSKTADVVYEGAFKVGYFLTAAVVRGDIGSVRIAIDTAASEASKFGELVSAHVIPQVYKGLEKRLSHF
jgi:microcompartment protein CcmL/EutN